MWSEHQVLVATHFNTGTYKNQYQYNAKVRKPLSPEMKREIRRLNMYIREMDLIAKQKLDSINDVESFIANTEIKIDEKLYFKEVAEKWLEQRKITIKESTYAKYEFTINKHLLPYFKNLKIKDLEQFNYNDFVTSLMKDLSAKTVKDIVCILKSILNYANDEYNCNIKIKRITSPKVQSENVTIMSNREKGRLENYCRKANTLKSIGIIICLNTGLRIGEICSLKWKDIELDKRLIFVKTTLQRIKDIGTNKTKIIIDKPKTQNSIRAIPISNKLYEILLPLKRKYKDNDFFLTGSSDKFVEPRNFQYEFKKILKKM